MSLSEILCSCGNNTFVIEYNSQKRKNKVVCQECKYKYAIKFERMMEHNRLRTRTPNKPAMDY